MTRSPIKSGTRVLVAWLVALLQLASALHFALVPHRFSAALGGIVHVHGAARGAAESRPPTRTVGVVADAPSCNADLCPTADLPPSSLLRQVSFATGWASFGDVCLLSERSLRSASSRRLFVSAPKTSPPV